jgi:hypothetical protein
VPTEEESAEARVRLLARVRHEAAHDAAQEKLRRARRLNVSRLDRLLMTSNDYLAQFYKLHEQPAGQPSATCRLGVPLSSPFAAHLDRSIARSITAQQERAAQLRLLGERARLPRAHTSSGALTVLEARRQLKTERADLSIVVEWCGFGLLGQREMAQQLGISQQAVSKRLSRGLALLEVWTRPVPLTDEEPAFEEPEPLDDVESFAVAA